MHMYACMHFSFLMKRKFKIVLSPKFLLFFFRCSRFRFLCNGQKMHACNHRNAFSKGILEPFIPELQFKKKHNNNKGLIIIGKLSYRKSRFLLFSKARFRLVAKKVDPSGFFFHSNELSSPHFRHFPTVFRVTV